MNSSTNQAPLFQFQQNQIHVVTLERTPWFHAGDVCECLGLSNSAGSSHHLSTLDPSDVTRPPLTDQSTLADLH